VDYVECEGPIELRQALTTRPYEALFVRLGLAVDQEVMRHAPSLRWVVTPSTGTDHIDVTAARQRGIDVVSLQGATDILRQVKSTAELTWALLLALVRHLPRACNDVHEGNWRRRPFLGDELDGRTLGIVGCGRLGRIVAGYGLAFGMTVLVHDIAREQIDAAPAGVSGCSFQDLLSTADVVSLHLPLNDRTRGYLSRDRLACFKPDAVLINTARGELVDETAMLEALESGRLAGAAVDVIGDDSRWPERPATIHPLIEYSRTHSNLLVTPHIGGYGRLAIARTREFITNRFLQLASASAPRPEHP